MSSWRTSAARSSAIFTIRSTSDLQPKPDVFSLNRMGIPLCGESGSTCWLGRRPACMGKPYSMDLRERMECLLQPGHAPLYEPLSLGVEERSFLRKRGQNVRTSPIKSTTANNRKSADCLNQASAGTAKAMARPRKQTGTDER